MTEKITISAPEEILKKIRLDKFLCENMVDFTRERIKKLIIQGMVELNNVAITSPAHKVHANDIYQITIPKPQSLEILPQNIPLQILYEDEHLVVINKPAGMSVHPSGNSVEDTLVNALLHHCQYGEGIKLSSIGGVERPGIVHRLDKGTSGVMVVAKDDKTHQGLSEQFSERSIERLYLAVCYGNPLGKNTQIETNIGRHPQNRKKMAVVEQGGKHALTTFKVLQNFNAEASLVQCKLFTGRTHQIRVHMTHIGNPLIADPIYGRKRKLSNEKANECISELNHQMLHATLLGFIHPVSQQKMCFEQDMPADMARLVSLFEC